MSTSATLCACGTLSTSVRPQGKTVPAGRPPSLATMATLSRACMVMYRGARGSVSLFMMCSECPGSMLEFDAPDVLHDHQVGKDGNQRVQADEDQCARKGAR